MNVKLTSIVFLVTGLCYLPAQAQSTSTMTDNASQKALLETQQMLRDPKAISKYLSDHPQAKKSDEQVQQLVGNDGKQDVYQLAADIMQNLVEETGGDVNKMMLILEKAKQDPNSFSSNWSPEQKEKLKAIADQIEKNSKTAPALH